MLPSFILMEDVSKSTESLVVLTETASRCNNDINLRQLRSVDLLSCHHTVVDSIPSPSNVAGIEGTAGTGREAAAPEAVALSSSSKFS